MRAGLIGPVAFLLTGVSSFCLLAGSPALGFHFSGATGATDCSNLNMADNASHTYVYVDLQSENADSMNWTRWNNMNPTKISTVYVGTGEDQTPYTDVAVLDRYYEDYCGKSWYDPDTNPYGVVGSVRCQRLVSSNDRCESHDLRMTNKFTDITTLSNRRGLACHENGHTVGLGHRAGTSTCMIQGYPKATLDYDSHDVNDAIGGHY